MSKYIIRGRVYQNGDNEFDTYTIQKVGSKAKLSLGINDVDKRFKAPCAKVVVINEKAMSVTYKKTKQDKLITKVYVHNDDITECEDQSAIAIENEKAVAKVFSESAEDSENDKKLPF